MMCYVRFWCKRKLRTVFIIFSLNVAKSVPKKDYGYCNSLIAATTIDVDIKLIQDSVSIYDKTSYYILAWWRHQMKTFSALLAICAGNSPVTDEFLAQRPVTRSFDVFFDLRLNIPLSKQWWGWWFETVSRPLWRHCNGSFVCVWAELLLRHLLRHLYAPSQWEAKLQCNVVSHLLGAYAKWP